jgi:hypothetical protein
MLLSSHLHVDIRKDEAQRRRSVINRLKVRRCQTPAMHKGMCIFLNSQSGRDTVCEILQRKEYLGLRTPASTTSGSHEPLHHIHVNLPTLHALRTSNTELTAQVHFDAEKKKRYNA